MSGVRAHGSKEVAKPIVDIGGRPGVLGVRREDKNKWERRAPVTPHHVQELVKQGIKVIVQPSTRRVFSDEEYRKVGAVLQEDLTECCTIAAVKEVPIDLLLPGRTYIFFSHTIKAQPSNMPLLDAVLEKRVRLLDYECITETGIRGGPRLVAFGNFAGYAGAIDFLRGLGERFLALGYSTPLLHIGSAFMYRSLEEARRAVSLAGETIRKYGLPAALCPFVAVFTGSGNVTKGALEIFELLPHEIIDPEDLPKIKPPGQGSRDECHKLYLSVAKAEHMVRHRHGRPFNKDQYYNEPDQYEPIFQDAVLPYSTVVVNCMYWDTRFPRLFTQEDVHRLVVEGHDRLLGVCDITCDADGSVPTRQFTSIEQPFFVLNALTETITTSLDDPGVLFHAVDHLPSELPREASQHFGNCLLPFIPSLVASKAPTALGNGDTNALPGPMKGAVIAEGGSLTPNYNYIDKLRSINERSDAEETAMQKFSEEQESLTPHGLHAPPAVCTLEISGHLFDTMFINKVCDLVESKRGRVQIQNIDVGGSVSDESAISMIVMAQSQEILDDLLEMIGDAAMEGKVSVRKAGANTDLGGKSLAPETPTRVLLFGAGFVCGPLVEYLLRRRENVITVASLERDEVEGFARKFGFRVKPQVLDVLSGDAKTHALLEDLVRSADVVVSLIPATMHVGIAKLAIKHQKNMVTASYVSPEMEQLDQEAKDAGIVIVNEVGLDPGIDHMSAMKMIDRVTSVKGSKVLSFSSLCGGLPAPECAGGNPIGYKFSWSPRGVLVAATNPSKWMLNGKLKEVPGSELLANAQPLTLNNSLALDVLPNRDSTAFADLYGLASAPTFFRGTLRYRGFCERMYAMAQIGLLEKGPVEGLKNLSGRVSCREWLARLLGTSPDEAALRDAINARLASKPEPVRKVGAEFAAWLGLLDDVPLPEKLPLNQPIDVFTALLKREELAYSPGERDMVAMYHELLVERPDGTRERHTATLIEYANVQGVTAMSRTVGITAAIAAQLVLDSPKNFGSGIQRPLSPEWYDPMLRRLEGEGIKLVERSEVVAVDRSRM